METLALSDAMLQEFQEGCLAPLREYVCADDTLTMRFLGRQVEVDYRGQVIIKVWQIGTKYSVYTMPFFNRYLDPAEGDNMDKILSLIPHYKNATDDLLWEDPDTTSERRQRMERTNNRAAGLSKHTDYYMVAGDYHLTQPDLPKGAAIDIVAVKGFVGEDDDTVPELTLALIQLCNERSVPDVEEQAFWDTDLETAMQGYLAATEILDKAQLARQLAADEEGMAALRENVARIFRQKCDLGLIDRYLDLNTEIRISPETPEVDLVAVDINPRQIGITSQLRRLAADAGPDGISIFEGAPMGMALYEDHLIPVSDYLTRLPVPKRRLREPNVLDGQDAARVHAALWLLGRVQERLKADGDLDWELLGRCLSRMEAFITALQERERAVLSRLDGGNERLEKAVGHMAAAEDALSVFEQLDSVEVESGQLSPEMRAAALEQIGQTEASMRAALDEYDLPAPPEYDLPELAAQD
ncbi:MAG: hypothetical protein HDQ87_08700 [Clostridia bacterium]|nr:hypothetical protein [Clostridia bacterium]